MKTLTLFLPLLLIACASHKAEENKTASESAQPSQEARFAANQNNAAYVAEVVFAKGSSRLSPAARKNIRDLMGKIKTGDVKEIKVVAWSDEEYPSVHTRKLSDREKNLARDRAENIKSKLEAGSAKIEILNMAERPGALGSLLQSDDARIKKSLEIAGIPNTDTAVKAPSKAGHGIVMVILQE